MAVEIFANVPAATVLSGGTTAPSPGTVQTWTVSSSAEFPAASSSASPPTQFHVGDVVLTSEIIAVTNVSGTTWTVTRGAEGTTPVAHTGGFEIVQVVTAGGLQQASRVDWISAVTMFGADPTGTADSTAAINSALSGAAFGQVVYLNTGTYKVTAPLIIPPGVILAGPGLYINVQTFPFGARAGAVIAPSSGFSGAAVAYVPDQAAGGWSVPAANSALLGVTIDGTSAPATVDHLRVYGSVFGFVFDRCNFWRPTGYGVNAIPNGANFPDLLKGYRSICNFNATGGIQLSHCPDSTLMDVYVLGGQSGGHCWSVTPSGNSHLIGCRGENTGAGAGFYLNGNPGLGQITLADCSTNLVGQDGVVISGTGAVIITGGYHYGAGQASTGYSSIKITGQADPVLIGGVNTTPALNGGSVNGPTNGLSVLSSSAHILISDSLIWGASAALNDDGSNSDIHIGPNCAFVTGAPGSPVFTYPGLQVTETGGTFTTAVSAASAAGEMFTVTNATAAPTNASTMLFAQSAGDKVLGVRKSGDANSTLDVFSNAVLRFGAGGTSATDTDFYRAGAGTLQTDGALTVSGALTAAISGQYLCRPTAYAPGTQTSLTLTGSVMAAFSSANVNTGSFIAPPSGDVVVTYSFALDTNTAGAALVTGLAQHATTTMVGNQVSWQDSATFDPRPVCVESLVTGLTAGGTYNLDLMGACGTPLKTVTILAIGQSGGTVTTTTGAPVFMSVRAV